MVVVLMMLLYFLVCVFKKPKVPFEIVCTDNDFYYFICFYFNTFCLVLFLGKCVCLHLYWKNIDCIYKYIYHLSGFEFGFCCASLCVHQKSSAETETKHTLRENISVCCTLTWTKSVVSWRMYWSYWNSLVCGWNSRGLFRGASYNTGELSTAKVNKVFNQSAGVYTRGQSRKCQMWVESACSLYRRL